MLNESYKLDDDRMSEAAEAQDEMFRESKKLSNSVLGTRANNQIDDSFDAQF